LLREGYKVVLNYSRDEKRASATLAEFKQISSQVYLIKADIGSPDEAGALIAGTIDEYGSLDVLVNNAARVADGPALEMTPDEWDRVS
jgi:NAD(P)-dependent dehydrogenase (short-subunit alcohol dehydrogenase family)